MNADGSFVVTWTDRNSATTGCDVFARNYDAQGNALKDEFRVNTHTADDQMYSSAAMDAHGDFVVMWSSRNQDGTGHDGWGVYGQRYDALGNPVGATEFLVNTTTAGDQMNSQVAMDAQGNFVAVWQSQGQDGSGWGVYGQRFDASGHPVGTTEFLVNNQLTTGNQQDASVAMNAQGMFVMSWTSDVLDGNGQKIGQNIYAQGYNPDGSFASGVVQANTSRYDDQNNLLDDCDYSATAIDPNGNFLVTWSSYGQDAPGAWGVYSQMFGTWGYTNGPENAGQQHHGGITVLFIGGISRHL